MTQTMKRIAIAMAEIKIARVRTGILGQDLLPHRVASTVL